MGKNYGFGSVADISNLRIAPAISGSVNMDHGTYQLQAAVDPVQPHTLPCINWKGNQAIDVDAGVRGWESQGGGLTYDLEGPDAQSVSVPHAPAFATGTHLGNGRAILDGQFEGHAVPRF